MSKKSTSRSGEEPRKLSVRDHPRASASVRRIRAWGGLIAFVLVLAGAHWAGADPFRAACNALGAGVAGMLVAWRLAQAYWQQTLRLEYLPPPGEPASRP
jgi:hypothetical protein